MSVLSRYTPICHGDGEESRDELAFERNMELMKKEFEREQPWKEILIRLMNLTYLVRREYILSDSSEVSATAILEQYPALGLGNYARIILGIIGPVSHQA